MDRMAVLPMSKAMLTRCLALIRSASSKIPSIGLDRLARCLAAGDLRFDDETAAETGTLVHQRL